MKRRDFMRLSGVTAGGVAAAAGPAAAQQGGNNSSGGGGNGTGGGMSGGNQSGGNASGGGNQSGSGSGGGQTTEVAVGPGGQLVYEPAEVQIEPGGTVRWVWESGGHNVAPESGDWGHQPIEDQGFTYEHTFESAGENPYVCTPHASAGMEGTIMVGSGSSGGGGEEEVDPEEMGVPIQAHYVGIGTILALILSLGYSFFILKYGESPHAKGGNN